MFMINMNLLSLNLKLRIKKKWNPAIKLSNVSNTVKSIGSQDKNVRLFMAPENKNKTKRISNEKKMFLMYFKYINLVF